MVRVIEDSPEEKATEKKNLEIMVEVAREMFGEENVSKVEIVRCVFIKDGSSPLSPIQISQLLNNTIYVYDQRYFNSAIKLGEAIEKRIPGLEFDLERMY